MFSSRENSLIAYFGASRPTLLLDPGTRARAARRAGDARRSADGVAPDSEMLSSFLILNVNITQLGCPVNQSMEAELAAHREIDEELKQLKQLAAFEGLERRCAHCGAEPEKLLRCGRCKAVKYCTTQCQRAAWCSHKSSCGKGCATPTPAAVRAAGFAATLATLREFGAAHGGLAEACLLKLKETPAPLAERAKMCEPVLAVVKAHGGRALAQSLGLGALSDYVGLRGGEAIAAIARLGGVEAALAALDAHGDHRLAVFEALKLLSNLAVRDECERAIRSSGGGPKAMAALRRLPRNANVKAAAESLLRNLGALHTVEPSRLDAVAEGFVRSAVAANCRPAAPSADDCPVCLGPCDGDVVALPCDHTFHRACIAKWFRESVKNTALRGAPADLNCPLCKRGLREQLKR